MNKGITLAGLGIGVTIALAIVAGFASINNKIDAHEQQDLGTVRDVSAVIQAQADFKETTKENFSEVNKKLDQLLWDNGHNPQSIIKKPL